ncbi:MAG: hypothetical protein JWQ84_2523 [Mucilaginibacter sp.]|nr:hypothetical protein [Mucilaginibacter sp.]
MAFLKKLKNINILKRIWIERLSEPIHLNIISLFVAAFGSIKSKIDFDLVIRQHHAYGLQFACKQAVSQNLKSFTAIEFGVASGAGLMNMITIAKKLEKAYDVRINILGFDTGAGMPSPIDYRDHPDLYLKGDFPMMFELLKERLPDNARLVIGNVHETIQEQLKLINPESPIGFVSFDLDYYSSTKDALLILNDQNPQKYLPVIAIYADDISLIPHNEYAGALLAIEEFNQASALRKICIPHFLEKERVFKNSKWLKQIRYGHIMDHSHRSEFKDTDQVLFIENPYIKFRGNKDKFSRS